MNYKNLDPVHMEAMMAERKLVEESPQKAGKRYRGRIWVSAVVLAVLLGLLALVLRTM